MVDKPTPTLSLIICTIGRAAGLERLFGSLEQQVGCPFEVILVDQNQDGRLQDLVRRYRSKFPIVHVKSSAGLSRARNRGLECAKAKVIGFPDDDCWYRAATLKYIIEFFSKNPEYQILLGRTVDAKGIESLSPFRASSGLVSKNNVWRSGNSNTLFVRSETAAQIRFDESLGVGAATPFKSGEETDFVLRALNLGKQAFFDRELLVHHARIDGQIGPVQLARARNYSAGFGYVLRKHGYSRSYISYRAIRSLVRGLIAVVMLDAATAKYKWAWMKGMLYGYFHPGQATTHGSDSASA